MHWHVSVGLRNVGLPENEVKIRILLPHIAKCIAQILDIIQGDASIALARNHVVYSKLTSTVISNQANLAAARLGNSWMGMLYIPGSKSGPKGSEIVTKLHFLVNLLSQEDCLT